MTKETAYTSHHTVTSSDNWSSRETPVSLNFVPMKNKPKSLSPMSAPPDDDYNEWHRD